MVVILL